MTKWFQFSYINRLHFGLLKEVHLSFDNKIQSSILINNRATQLNRSNRQKVLSTNFVNGEYHVFYQPKRVISHTIYQPNITVLQKFYKKFYKKVLIEWIVPNTEKYWGEKIQTNNISTKSVLIKILNFHYIEKDAES